MKHWYRMSVGLALALAVGWGSPVAFALTAQDKADKNITDDGQSRGVETGTILQESVTDTSLGGSSGGESSPGLVLCGTVPTDKNWLVTNVSYTYAGTVTNVRVALLADGKTIDQDGAPTSNEAQRFDVRFWVDEGELVQLEAYGYTATDDLSCRVFGIEYPDAGS
jgi:hypothetical protein